MPLLANASKGSLNSPVAERCVIIAGLVTNLGIDVVRAILHVSEHSADLLRAVLVIAVELAVAGCLMVSIWRSLRIGFVILIILTGFFIFGGLFDLTIQYLAHYKGLQQTIARFISPEHVIYSAIDLVILILCAARLKGSKNPN